ncbi:MAG: hypothetical protein MUE67_03930 [Anaerolineales bacterium]|jgi:voltage-gated potassium channel Kch|nr:hypothetical protein [Anaerolineales bacterium]
MKETPSLMERLRYRLDTIYSRDTRAAVITLGLLTLLMTTISTMILVIAGLAPGGEESYTTVEAFWVSLISAIGDGSVGGRETGWGYRLLMLGMTFGSIFIGSFFISALTNGLVSRVNELKRGRSIVIEQGHTVILGWSDQIFTVLTELMHANASHPEAVIVVLGPASKEDMEDQIKQKVKKIGRTRIVCRTGDPMEMGDLKLVSLNTAKTVIILPPASEYPDADVIKTTLAITKNPQRRKAPYHIVAGIRNPRNQEIASVAGNGEVEWLVTSEVVSRVIAQTSLQPGLSTVYDDLFDFEDQEIYLKSESMLCGRPFSQALFASDHNTVIGIVTGKGQVLLNPPNDRIIQHDDQLVVIARDDLEIHFDIQGLGKHNPDHISLGELPPIQSKRILILGWNWRGKRILEELDKYVSPGSEITVLADQEKVAEQIPVDCLDFQNLQVCFLPEDTDDRQILEGILFKPYDHVVVLGYSDQLSIQRADAKTLVTLLHLRDVKERDNLDFTIVTEMMDIRNYELASTARADDYVVSDRLVSLMMAQVAENRPLNAVFTDLLSAQGAEIYLKPVSLYIKQDQPVNFYSVVEAARQRGEIAIGYRLAPRAGVANSEYSVVVNPKKSAEVTFTQQDRIVVLAESQF